MYLNARYNYVLWDKILHNNPSSHDVIESLCNVSLNKDYIIVMLPGFNHASFPIPFSLFIDLWNKALYRIFNRTNVPPTHTHTSFPIHWNMQSLNDLGHFDWGCQLSGGSVRYCSLELAWGAGVASLVLIGEQKKYISWTHYTLLWMSKTGPY